MKKNGKKVGDQSFSGVMGNSPRVKIWEFLLIGRNFEYHIKDIAQGADISRTTCHAEVKKLLGLKIVNKGKKYKGKQLYKLNKESPIARAVLKSFKTMLYK